MLDAWWHVNRKPLDDTEFEGTFRTHYEGVYRLLFRLSGSAEEAADLAQETFLRLYRQRFPSWREHDMRAWLYRVAVNLAYNTLRSGQRRERRQQAVARMADPGGPDPAETAVRTEEQESVRHVLAELPARQSKLLLLYYAGLSYQELAQAVGVAAGSVGTLLSRAKTAFEARYRARYGAPQGGAPQGGSDEV
jgi:RNA polymerase sigma factor (sigma-70 family)